MLLSEFAAGSRMLGCLLRRVASRTGFPIGKSSLSVRTVRFTRKNRKWIDRWMPEILRFPPSLQKLEWNCKGGDRDIWKYVIQFRASGVRVKRPSSSPSLIAMTRTQVPIIAWNGDT